jgi:hypothetical protein
MIQLLLRSRDTLSYRLVVVYGGYDTKFRSSVVNQSLRCMDWHSGVWVAMGLNRIDENRRVSSPTNLVLMEVRYPWQSPPRYIKVPGAEGPH